MSELSVFVDESGDTGEDSRLYLLTLVFHDQGSPIGGATAAYEARLAEAGLRDVPFHMQPLLSGEGDYEGIDIPTRVKMLDRGYTLIRVDFSFSGIASTPLPLAHMIFGR